MEERIIFAGAGGQGLMLLGKLMAQAALSEGLEVSWFPSYGAEVRGGTAHCHVVISDREVYSPLVEKASTLVVMNEPSLKRFLPRLGPGGLLILNSSLATAPEAANGALVLVPATDIANELGNIRVANMVMLGAMNAARRVVSDETIAATLREYLHGREALVDLNLSAYRRGAESAP